MTDKKQNCPYAEKMYKQNVGLYKCTNPEPCEDKFEYADRKYCIMKLNKESFWKIKEKNLTTTKIETFIY